MQWQRDGGGWWSSPKTMRNKRVTIILAHTKSCDKIIHNRCSNLLLPLPKIEKPKTPLLHTSHVPQIHFAYNLCNLQGTTYHYSTHQPPKTVTFPQKWRSWEPWKGRKELHGVLQGRERSLLLTLRISERNLSSHHLLSYHQDHFHPLDQVPNYVNHILSVQLLI